MLLCAYISCGFSVSKLILCAHITCGVSTSISVFVRISCDFSVSTFCFYAIFGACGSVLLCVYVSCFSVFFLFTFYYSLCLNFVLYPNGLYSIFPCVHIPFSSCLYSVFSGSLFRLNDSKQFLSHLDVPYEDSGHDTERVWRDERTDERTITFTSKTKQKLEEVLVMPLFG